MERLPAAMASHGLASAVMSPPGFYCARTRFLTRRFALPRHCRMWLGAPFLRPRLEGVVRSWKPDLIVPLDDLASWLLRRVLASQSASDALLLLLEASFGAPEGYLAHCSRIELLRVASALGVRTPPYRAVDNEAAAMRAAEAWGYPVVLKAEHSCGGCGVTIVRGPEALRAAMSASRSINLVARFRTAGKYRMWELAGLTGLSTMPPILQAFAPGKPAMRTVLAWRGRVIDGISFTAEHVHPEPTGASTMVRYVENLDMDMAAEALVKALGASGFLSLDFMLDEHHGHAHLIEMNSRPIGTTHLGRMFGHDLCGALAALLRGKPVTPYCANEDRSRAVALFPKELERDPSCLGRFQSNEILHDVPHDDPAVISAYLRRLACIHPGAIGAMTRLVNPPGVRLTPAPDRTLRLSMESMR
ncbi:MAG TPA: ATP-grasp domain-containing protein [Acetobacteraceae bacterium]|nr:ATP-grasp domain-containing protein [Acetobacteraceae bacterium]